MTMRLIKDEIQPWRWSYYMPPVTDMLILWTNYVITGQTDSAANENSIDVSACQKCGEFRGHGHVCKQPEPTTPPEWGKLREMFHDWFEQGMSRVKWEKKWGFTSDGHPDYNMMKTLDSCLAAQAARGREVVEMLEKQDGTRTAEGLCAIFHVPYDYEKNPSWLAWRNALISKARHAFGLDAAEADPRTGDAKPGEKSATSSAARPTYTPGKVGTHTTRGIGMGWDQAAACYFHKGIGYITTEIPLPICCGKAGA